MVKSHTSAPLQSADQEKEADLRGWINWLDTWRVCANTVCERARCCRGKASACFPENFPRLPLGVRDSFIALISAKEDGLPFEDAWAELTRVGLVAELANWQALVHGEAGAIGLAN
jgi:hypothetical protein